MISLISANWLMLLIALLIGIATAFWAWAMSGRESGAEHFDANDGLLEKAGQAVVDPPKAEPVQPVAAKPEVAKPAPAAEQPAAAPTPAPAPAPKAVTPRPRKPAVAETPAPAPEGKPEIAPAVGEPDNLRLIKGVGPKLNTLLNNLGITRFDQIAAWKEKEIQEVDRYLESFSGRITRDGWIDQAKYLAKDDIAGFEKKYGKL